MKSISARFVSCQIENSPASPLSCRSGIILSKVVQNEIGRKQQRRPERHAAGRPGSGQEAGRTMMAVDGLQQTGGAALSTTDECQPGAGQAVGQLAGKDAA